MSSETAVSVLKKLIIVLLAVELVVGGYHSIRDGFGSSVSTSSETVASAAGQTVSYQVTDSWDHSGLQKITPTDITATQYLTTSNKEYPPSNASDGNDATSWQVRTDASGAGEAVTVQLPDNTSVQCIGLKSGNWNGSDNYACNNRPKDLTMEINGESYDISTSDQMTEHYVVFDSPVTTDSIKLTIRDVYQGSKWNDTCISEIEVY